jgi:hypothetical protein
VGEGSPQLGDLIGIIVLASDDGSLDELVVPDTRAGGGADLAGRPALAWDVHVHGFYAEFLFTHERDAEALETIDHARRTRPTDPDVFMVIGETLDAHHRHVEAAKWLTTGLVRYYGDLASITADDLDDDYDGALLATARRRARANAELLEDHLDTLARQHLDENDEES